MKRSTCAKALAGALMTFLGLSAQSASAQNLQCSGTNCFSDPSPLPNGVNEGTTWNPCGGHPFTWLALLDFETGWDSVVINGTAYDGAKSAYGRAAGAIDVSIHTDVSVESNGLQMLEAFCDDSITYLEAECPDTSVGGYSNKQTTGSGYSGSGYLLSNVAASSPGNSDRATYSFATAAGGYDFQFRIDTGGNGSKDSWYYRIDSGTWVTMNNFSSLGSGWRWAKSAAPKTLTAGYHTVEIATREAGLKIDKLAILPAGTATPTALGGEATNCAPDITCGTKLCTNGETCCGSFNVDFACMPAGVSCHALPSPIIGALACDSHGDCGTGNKCVGTISGNGDASVGCVTDAALTAPGSTFRKACAGPGWSAPTSCPSGSTCRPFTLGVSTCQ